MVAPVVASTTSPTQERVLRKGRGEKELSLAFFLFYRNQVIVYCVLLVLQ